VKDEKKEEKEKKRLHNSRKKEAEGSYHSNENILHPSMRNAKVE
jgi:hypothetical protein